MKLYYYKDNIGNFGDDLNPRIFKYFLPNITTDSSAINIEDSCLTGIGTLLNNTIPVCNEINVFSTGAGYGDGVCKQNLKFHCVRGLLTAKIYNIPESKAIADGAYLLRLMHTNPQTTTNRTKFFPHHTTAQEQDWSNVCTDMDIDLVNPFGDIDKIIHEIRSAKLVIAEAMHAAIVADAFGVPWIPVSTNSKILKFKWIDWLSVFGHQDIELNNIPALWRTPNGSNIKKFSKEILAKYTIKKLINNKKPLLNQESKIREKTFKLQECLAGIKI